MCCEGGVATAAVACRGASALQGEAEALDEERGEDVGPLGEPELAQLLLELEAQVPFDQGVVEKQLLRADRAVWRAEPAVVTPGEADGLASSVADPDPSARGWCSVRSRRTCVRGGRTHATERGACARTCLRRERRRESAAGSSSDESSTTTGAEASAALRLRGGMPTSLSRPWRSRQRVSPPLGCGRGRNTRSREPLPVLRVAHSRSHKRTTPGPENHTWRIPVHTKTQPRDPRRTHPHLGMNARNLNGGRLTNPRGGRGQQRLRPRESNRQLIVRTGDS